MECSAPLINCLSKAIFSIFVSVSLVCGNAFSADKSRFYNIPVQSLNDALVKFAIISDLELIFTADKVRGINSNALSSHMTDKEALEQLLQGSNFGYYFVDVKTVTLVAKNEIKNAETKPLPAQQTFTPDRIKILHPMTVMGNKKNSANSPSTYTITYSGSATKTVTAIKHIPQSIHALSRPVINNQQNLTISESLKNISGIVTDNALITPSFDSTLIRGFKAEQLLDGFTQYYNPGDRESLTNIERIEVLKGSNALLYGGGSGSPAGGLVNIISKLPMPVERYEVGMKYGSYQYYQPYFDLNQPINQNVLFRLTGEYTHLESHIDVIETERFNINPALTLINNDTTLTLQGKISNWQQQDYQGLPAVGTVAGDFKIPVETFIGSKDIEPSEAEFYGVWGELKHSINDIWSLSLKGRYSESKFDQKVQVLWGSDGVLADQPLIQPSTWALFNSELFQEQKEVSLVANIVAEFDLGVTENTVLLGADYSEIYDQGFFEFVPITNGFVDLSSPRFESAYSYPGIRKNTLFIRNTTYGGYLQVQSSFYERLHIVVGARLGFVDIDYQNEVPGGFSGHSNKFKLLPRAGAVFDLTNEFSVFVNYSQGMRGQSFANFNEKPEPELSSHLEAGIKFDIADQLTGQVAVYRIERKNVLFTNNAGTPRTSFLNGRQRSKGIEADLIWQLNDSFNILANYAYTEASFSKSQAGINAGDMLAGVPKHSGRLWADYHFHQAPFTGLNLGAGIYAQSGVYVSNTHLFKTDSYYTVDASLGYEIENYRLGLSIKNLTDQRYFERIDYLGGSVAPSQGTSLFSTFSVHW